MRKLLYLILFLVPALSDAQSNKLDSAIIILKNVTRDTFATVTVTIKGQEITTINLKPNEEDSETISTYCVAPDCTPTYKFTIQKTNGGYGVLNSDDYKAMIGDVDITTGTYIYYISWGKNPVEQWPDLKLQKLK